MKAAQITNYGDSSVIQINDVDKPTVHTGQVLVAVHAASLNPFDTMVREGYLKDMIPLQFPVTLGGDIAGVVAAVSDDVTEFSVGDRVYGQAHAVAGNSGALAEFAATAASQLARIPADIDFIQAASLPLAGVSALQALKTPINLQPGQKIFIHGGAGGIGSLAIQIAKQIGAYVATTATGDGIALAKQLGANEVIDYKTQDFSDVLNDYDAVLNTVGGEAPTKTLEVLKKGGVAVSLAGPAEEANAIELGVKAIAQNTHVTTDMLNELAQLVESGAVVAQIDGVFPLEQAKEAFEARENTSIKGKIVISVQ